MIPILELEITEDAIKPYLYPIMITLSISGFLKEWHPETLFANQISKNNIMIILLCAWLFELNGIALVLDELRGCVA